MIGIKLIQLAFEMSKDQLRTNRFYMNRRYKRSEREDGGRLT